jgi:hypothetical protein
MASIDNLVEDYQATLSLITIVQDTFLKEYKFKEGEWMNDFVYLGQCFLNAGQAMREELYAQEAIISMYHSRFGPLEGDPLQLAIKNAQEEDAD